MTKKYKIHLLLSSITMLLPMLSGSILWRAFPERIAIHWNLQGVADGTAGKGFVVFGVPLILLLLHFLLLFFIMMDKKNKEQSKKIVVLTFWILPVLSLVIWWGIYGGIFGNLLDPVKVILMIIPLMFIVIGNYLPKCKQNYTIGIRVVWALRNEENWNKTHRFAGKLWVYGGTLLIAFIPVMPIENFAGILGVLPLLMAMIPILYSYLYYKKQLKEGKVSKEEIKSTPNEKKISIVVAIFIIVILLLIFCKGNYEIQFEENSFSIQADLWQDMTVSYDTIEKIEFLERKKEGRRTMGYGSMNILMGIFENSTWGTYTAYLNTKTESCILLTIDGKILIINENDNQKTQKLYDKLLACCKKE